MPDHSLLEPWANFYVITGSAAAALTGLVFVVITLVTQAEGARRSHEGTANYTTPTVVHFGAVLLISATLCAPWRWLIYASIVLGLAGLYGIAYVLRVAYRIRRMETYTPDTEDWVWHTLLPLLTYGTILAGAVTLPARAPQPPFVIAAAVVMLIFVGIHNAWDIVTFIAIDRPEQTPDQSERRQSS